MLDVLARLLGLSRTDAEASLYSERAARHVLTRRDAFGLAGAMCAGVVLGDAIPEPLSQYIFREGEWVTEGRLVAGWNPIVWHTKVHFEADG